MAKQIQDINTNTKQSVGTNGSSADWTNLVSELTKEYGTFSETAPSSSDGLGDTKSTYGICPSKKVWTNIDSVLSESDFVVNGSYSDNQLVDIDDVVFSYKNPTISISSSSMSFAAVGEAKTVTVTIAHVPDNTYSVTCADSWVTISKSGATVTLTAAKNTGNARSTTVTFSCDGRANTTSASTTLSVSQSAASISLSNTSSSVSYKAQSVSTTVTSSYGWTLSGVPGWLTASKSSGNSGDTVTFTTTKNTSADQRSCTITFTCGTKTKSLSIVQLGYPSISLGATSGSITPAAQTKNVTVSYSNLNYYTVTSNAAWATVPSGNQTGSSFNISASKNSSTQRQATITVQGYDHDGSALTELKKTYTLTQTTGVTTISVSPTSLSFTPAAANKTATVTYSNTSGYSVSSNQSWCTVSKSGNTVTVSATKNSGGQRTATVTITATAGTYDGATPKCTIVVTQSSGVSSFSVSPDTISLTSNAAASKSFTVSQTNVSSWSVSSKPSWVTVDTTNKTISITKNTGSDRSGTISFSATGTYDGATRTDSIAVTQEGISVLDLKPDAGLSFAPAAGSGTIYAEKTNLTSATVSDNADWCTLTKSSGTNAKDTYTVAVTKNSGSARSCTITATGTGDSDSTSRTDTITVSQSSGVSSMTVKNSSGTTLSSGYDVGGTYAAISSTFTVTTTNTGNWSASSGATWCTLNKTSGSSGASFTISAAKNTGNARNTTVTVTSTGTYDSKTHTFTFDVSQASGKSVITVTPASKTFTHAAQNDTVTVSLTNATGYNVSSNQSWCTVSNNSNKITVAEYYSATSSNRSATVTFTATGTVDGASPTDTVTVTQSPSAYLSANPTTWSSVPATGGNKSVKITTYNCTGFSVRDGLPDWLTATVSGDYVSLTAAENETTSARLHTVYFDTVGGADGSSDYHYITVSQLAGTIEHELDVTPDSATSIKVNKATTLKATYYTVINGRRKYSSDVTTNSSTTWTTSSSTNATVSKGTVTGKKGKDDGTTTNVAVTITATYNGYSDSTTVNVSDNIEYGLDVTPDSGNTVNVGSTLSLTAKYYTMVNGTRRTSLDSTVTTSSSTTWTSSSTTNATVSKGTVTGKKGKDDGTTTAYNVTITATYSGKSDSTTVGISDNIEYGLDVTPDSGNTVQVGKEIKLIATYYTKINGTRKTTLDRNVTTVSGTDWTSSDTTHARVTGGGYVKGVLGKNDGTADEYAVTITATYGGKSDSTTVGVCDVITYFLYLHTISGNPSLNVGNTTSYVASLRPKINGTSNSSYDIDVTSNCTWTSSSTTNATVSSGVVTAVLGKDDGTTNSVAVTITATYNEYSKSTTVNVSDVITYGLDLTPNSGNTVQAGSTLGLTAKYYTMVNGIRKTSLDRDVTTSTRTNWTSSSTTNATVYRGTVTGVLGKNDGTTDEYTVTITAKYNYKSDSTTVNVYDVITYGLALDGATSVNAGSSITLTPAYVTYINGTRKTSLDNTNISCTWTSSNTNIATVSGGVVTGKASTYGSVTITAKYGATYTATHTVQVNYSYSYFEITPDETELNAGTSTHITSKLYTFTNGSTTSSTISASNVTFTSSDTTLATVNTWGTVSIQSRVYGTVTITGTYSGYSDTCTITIHYTIESFVVVPSSATIKVGNTIDLSGEWITTNDGVETSRTAVAASDITWSTTSSSYFEVNSGGVAGRVKGLKKTYGHAFNVKGTYNSEDANCEIIVDEVATPSISASPTSVSGTYPGGTYTSTITVTNVTSYTASCTAGWVTLSKGAVSSGKSTLTVTLAANTSTSGRSATISLSCSNDDGSASATIIVGQTGKPEPYIDVTPTSVTFGASSYSQQTFTVTQTGSSFSLDSSQTKPSWLTTSISGNKLYITPNSANTSTTARTGYVYLKGNDGATTTSSGAACRIYVTQSGATSTPTLTVSPTTWSATNVASSKKFTVTSDNSNWTIQGYPDWITLSGRTGTGATFSMSANMGTSTRSGVIVFKHAITSTIASVAVTQSGVTYNTYPFKIVSNSSNIHINGGTLYVQDSSTSSPIDDIDFEGSLISSSSTVTIDNFSYQSNYAVSESVFNNLYFWLEIGVSPTSFTYKFYDGNTLITTVSNAMSTLKLGSRSQRYKVSDYWTYSEYTSGNIKLRIEQEAASSGGGSGMEGRATFSNTSGWTTDNATLNSRLTYPNVPNGYSIAGSNIAGTNNGIAKARINISGYTGSYTVKLVSGLASGNIEQRYDYGVIGKLDNDLSSTKFSGGLSITMPSTVIAWTWNAMECSYTFIIPDTSSHFIDVYYRKDGSGNSGDDCVYCLYQNSFA